MDVHGKLIAKVKSYRMPDRGYELVRKHQPLLIAGISAAGKSSVIKHIVAQGKSSHVITHTTRGPRQNEINGQNYWFVSESEMLLLVEKDSFIEVNPVHGETIYGTSIDEYEKVSKAGLQPVLIIDVQGIDDITKKIPDLRAKFILPPDIEEWLSRLSKREIMTAVDRHRRTQSARQEIEKALSDRHFDIVINRDLAQAADEVLHGSNDTLRQEQNREIAHHMLESINYY